MSDTNNLKAFNGLKMKPSVEYERLAKIHERQRRDRKEELYSYHAKNHKVCNKS